MQENLINYVFLQKFIDIKCGQYFEGTNYS